MTNARGNVAFIIEATSAELPSMLRMLKFGGKSPRASRRLPPSRSVAGSRGLTSLVVPTDALLPAEGVRSMAGEHPVSANAATTSRLSNRRDCVQRLDFPLKGALSAGSAQENARLDIL